MKRLSRRGLIVTASTLASTMALAGPAWAALAPTPRSTAGPFYPVRLPADHDADLVRVEAAVREAGGEILHLSGRVSDIGGQAVAGAVIEIWQCDVNGIYLHPRDPRHDERDAAFQGFGRATTDAHGRFRFRTILPVPYTGRTPHIHARFLSDARERLTTQFYVDGHHQNAGDFLFRRLTPAQQQRASMVIRQHRAGERPQWETAIDVVLDVG